jgi:hypothetical protein
MYLQGCSIPVILRETAARENATSKMFSVVGGAYLHWEQHESYDACCKFVKTGLWEKGVRWRRRFCADKNILSSHSVETQKFNDRQWY